MKQEDETVLTIGEIIEHPVFQEQVNKKLKDLLSRRRSRPAPKPGFKYKKDWYDRIPANQCNAKFFIASIPEIWVKTSNLERNTRHVIQYVCDLALMETLQLLPKK